MNRGVIEAILTAYGLTYSRILPPQKGYRNQSFGVELRGGRLINLILYKSEPGILSKIKHANNVGDFLASAGFPARRTYSNKIIQLKAGDHIKYGALYNYLPGSTIPWEAYTKEHIKTLGGTLSNMHKALTAHNSAGLPTVVAENIAILERMQTYFLNNQVAGALKTKLGIIVLKHNFRPLLAACSALPGQQTLHMDFVRGNVLFEGKSISGILDFEKTSFGHPLFDIARTLAFLLIDCKHKEDTKIRKYFLHSGYNKRGASRCAQTAHEKRLLEALVGFYMLYDFYKFLRHNPYESLPQNEHFVRTVKALRKRGIIG